MACLFYSHLQCFMSLLLDETLWRSENRTAVKLQLILQFYYKYIRSKLSNRKILAIQSSRMYLLGWNLCTYLVMSLGSKETPIPGFAMPQSDGTHCTFYHRGHITSRPEAHLLHFPAGLPNLHHCTLTWINCELQHYKSPRTRHSPTFSRRDNYNLLTCIFLGVISYPHWCSHQNTCFRDCSVTQ